MKFSRSRGQWTLRARPLQLVHAASHRRSHNVVYQTARTDLMGLVEKGLFQVSKRGKTQYFLARENLEKKLGSLR